MKTINVDIKRLDKIGIDRVVLNNFKINNFEKLNKKETVTDIEYTEFFKEKNKLFSLNYSTHLKLNGDMYIISSLEFNPNKIIEGHNIYNSTTEELLSSIEYLLKKISKNGIELDITEAKVKELEINITFIQSFKKLEEVITMIGGANYKKSLGLHSYEHKKKLKDMKIDRSLYINSKIEETQRDIKGKVIKIYDKSFELKRNSNLEVDEELTRVEVVAGRDYYREYMKSLDLTNSLIDLVENKELLEVLFKKSIEQELATKPREYIENILKKRLKYDFINFRRNEKVKRIERKKLKDQGKEIPKHLKEERGVFEYLDKESWIFDYNYLLEIILTELDPKNRDKFHIQITKKYQHKNNSKVFDNLLKTVKLQ